MLIKPTKLEHARVELLKSIKLKKNVIEVPLQKALERISYKKIDSKLNLPSTANSAVDGYGISSATYFNNPKTEFIVIGIAKAGHPFTKKILPGQAVEIYTGAIMPKGIDTIVMHEKCERINHKVKIKEHIKTNQNMRPVGENLKKGESVVNKGKLLNSADIGQLAASGNSKVSVYEKVRVSVISTGDELISANSKNRLEGQIYDSNKPMLLSLLSQNYLKLSDMGIVKDNRSKLAKKYAEALSKSDVVISSGGASDGIEDHTQNALKDVGAKCLVWQLAMKPGKPMAVGTIENKFIFCLPGNPVAAFVCTKLLIKPLLIRMSGGGDLEPLEIKLPSAFEHNKRIGRAEYLRAKIVNDGKSTMIKLHGRKGAGVISSLTGADGIVEIPMELKRVSIGDLLRFFPFEHRGL
jgi:molybdopterin molybdotransferase